MNPASAETPSRRTDSASDAPAALRRHTPSHQEVVNVQNVLPPDFSGNPRPVPSSAPSVRKLLPQHLSRELQLYFSRITLVLGQWRASASSDADVQAVLRSLASDAGLQELAPYLVHFVRTEIYSGLRSVPRLRRMMQLLNAILDNKRMHLEVYLDQILPPVLTCVVGARLGDLSGGDDHRTLRRVAAQTAVRVCEMFPQYRTLRSRVLLTLLRGIGAEEEGEEGKLGAPGTQYGSLVGVAAFGPLAVGANLLPGAVGYWRQLEGALEEVAKSLADKGSSQRGEDIMECQRALLEAIGMVLDDSAGGEVVGKASTATSSVHRMEVLLPGDTKLVGNIADNFGEKLVPFYSRANSELVTSFI
uniref:TAF6 C-terminal HEAT repeat domain-containing protein n=1 Tax=Corethron hystrix TaxID=216773 RepID=A0A7S1BT69_9STRA